MKDNISIEERILQEATGGLEPQFQLDLPLNTLKVFIIIRLAQVKS